MQPVPPGLLLQHGDEVLPVTHEDGAAKPTVAVVSLGHQTSVAPLRADRLCAWTRRLTSTGWGVRADDPRGGLFDESAELETMREVAGVEFGGIERTAYPFEHGVVLGLTGQSGPRSVRSPGPAESGFLRGAVP